MTRQAGPASETVNSAAADDGILRRRGRLTGGVRKILRSLAGLGGSALIGFVFGAVFWHFVGFWSFVRDVIYQGPATGRQVALQYGRQCTDLVLDRTTGKMTPASCPDEAQALVEAPTAGRADHAARAKNPSSVRWTVTVQAERDELSTGSD